MNDKQKQWETFQRNDPEAVKLNRLFSALHLAFDGLDPYCSGAAKVLFRQLADQVDRDCSKHLGNRILELSRAAKN